MLFLVFNIIDCHFGVEKSIWKFHTIAEALSIINKVEIIDKTKHAKTALDKNSKTFIVYVAILQVLTAISIHLSKASKIQDDLILAALQWDKAPTKIPAIYSDYAEVFSSDLVMELLKNTGINENAIKLIDGKQLLYMFIYALSLIELKSLKTYIKTKLKTRFIWPFKSPIGTPILFDKKFDGNLCLYINY